MTRALVLALYLTACGRFSFDPSMAADGSVAADTSADASDAAPVTPMCLANHLLCDSLDSALDTTVWNDTGGMLSRDTTIVHRGTSSLKMTIPTTPAGTQVGSYIAHVGSDISSATELWIRAWLRMNALPLSTNALELLTLQQTGGLGVFVFSRSYATQLYHQFDTKNGETSMTPPLDTWFCLVWHVTLETTSIGRSDVTSDILPPFSISNSITQGSPPMDNVGFGPFFSASNVDVAQPTFDVWVDDILVDDAPVTCAE